MNFIQLVNYLINYELWGLGIGDWGLGPIPNPQSPIPNNDVVIITYFYYYKYN